MTWHGRHFLNFNLPPAHSSYGPCSTETRFRNTKELVPLSIICSQIPLHSMHSTSNLNRAVAVKKWGTWPSQLIASLKNNHRRDHFWLDCNVPECWWEHPWDSVMKGAESCVLSLSETSPEACETMWWNWENHDRTCDMIGPDGSLLGTKQSCPHVLESPDWPHITYASSLSSKCNPQGISMFLELFWFEAIQM